MTILEAALATIKVRLVDAFPDAVVRRNETLPEEIPPGFYLVLYDGELRDREELIGVEHYVFEHEAVLEMHIAGHEDDDNRAAMLAALVNQVIGVLRVDRDLGGLVDRVDPQPVTNGHDAASAGGASFATATMPLVLEYQSDLPHG